MDNLVRKNKESIISAYQNKMVQNKTSKEYFEEAQMMKKLDNDVLKPGEQVLVKKDLGGPLKGGGGTGNLRGGVKKM